MQQPQQQHQGAQAYSPEYQHQQQHQAPPSLQQQGGGYMPPPQQQGGGYPPQQQGGGGYPPQQQQGGYMGYLPPQQQQQMGNYPPQQQQQQQPPGTIAVYYLDNDCCECMACGCCGCQPTRDEENLHVYIDDKGRGSMSQGASQEFSVPPGNHRVDTNGPGVITGFLSSIGVGSAKKGGVSVMVMSGQTVNMEMGWKHINGAKYHSYIKKR